MSSSQNDPPVLSYFDRLATFQDSYWDDADATARQLAALGHVSDRLPRERYEEGSRCATCSLFVSKAISVENLEGDINPERFNTIVVPPFHTLRCKRRQVRLPYETPRWFMICSERASKRSRPTAISTSSEGGAKIGLLSLPIELRLIIYELAFPLNYALIAVLQHDRDMMRLRTLDDGGTIYHKRIINAFHSPLLQVCNTTNREFSELLYSRTTIQVDSTKILYMFLRRIGRRGRACVRHIILDRNVGTRDDALAFALLASCEALSSIVMAFHRLTLVPSLFNGQLWLEDGIACLVSISGLRAKNVTILFGFGNRSMSRDPVSEKNSCMMKALLSRKRGSPVVWQDILASASGDGPFGVSET